MWPTYRIISILVFFQFLFTSLNSQVDSFSLSTDKLGIKDIHITKEEVLQNKVFTASRTLNNVEELPYSIYIITGEEILSKGMLTLGDVLKQVPGIYVSQPGSALHGETFIVNGLFGNTHTKIMIDNVPIKPYDASGLPIAQQLPIRQSERIEITYGPSAIDTGSDAGAATINIVTRKSERPLYVHADLAIGTERYNTMNVIFGGKIGKKKNTLKFKAYGTYSILDNLDLATVNPYFDPASYPLNSFSVLQDTSSDISNIGLNNRQLSFDVRFRSFQLTVSQMFRNSHSAIGSSPLAINYNDPSTSYGERISLVNFLYKKELQKVGFSIQFKYSGISVNQESTIDYRFPFEKQQLDRITNEIANGNPEARDSMIAITDARYFDGKRYQLGNTGEFLFAPSISIFPIKNVELLLMPQSQIIGISRFEFYNKNPRSSFEFGDGNGIQINTNLIAKAYIKLKKMNFILGLNKFNSIILDPQISDLNTRGKLLPHFAGLYKLDKNLSLRVNYSNSYLIPSSYWMSKGGEIPKTTFDRVIQRNDTFQLNPQETKYGEVGIRWKINESTNLDFAAYKSQNTNLLNFKQQEDEDSFYYGFDNSAGNSSNITGLRLSIRAKDIIERIKLSVNGNFNYTTGKQELLSGETIDRLLTQPKYIAQIGVSLRPVRKLLVSIDNVFIGDYFANSITSMAEYDQANLSIFRRNASWSMNVSVSLSLSDNFNIFLIANNNSSNFLPGIDATGSPNDISLNTQRYEYLLTGINYTLD